jgi:ABC-type multidrug transport system ATPase subunit
VKAGRVCAILGPSGSGKSSLLNVLAGRSASSGPVRITGHVKVDGQAIDPVKFRKNIAYVMQDDALMATCTPREVLRFSAVLRLDDRPLEEIDDLVNQTLKALGIEECADVYIGNALIKGISGGQRKRTSVGMELITSPSLVFLDEPTSGLDSYTAFQLIHLLRKIASSNATVLCTIHQPSSEVFQLFDTAIFLVKGRILYQGSTDKIVDFFGARGYKCPDDYNTADFVLYVAQTETEETLEQDGFLKKALPSPRAAGGTDGFGHEKEDNDYAGEEEMEVVVKAGFFKQIYWVFSREVVGTSRNIPALVGRFGVTAILSIIFGLIFLNAADQNDANPTNFNSHYGVVTMLMINAMFGSAQPTLLEFPNERPVFMREYSTGTYSPVTYSLGKILVEIPLLFLQALLQMVIMYNLAGLQGDFIALVGASFGTGITTSSSAALLGCLVTDPKQANEMAPLIMVPQILFAGFFIRTNQIPIWMRWAQYLCSLKYGINLFLINEFASFRQSCDDGAAENCRNIQEVNDVEPSDWWVYVLILFALFSVQRILAMIVLTKRAVKFY